MHKTSGFGRETQDLRRRVANLVVLASFVTVTAATANASGLSLASQNLTVYRTCALTMTPSTSTVGFDATTRQNAASTNRGTATTMEVRSLTGANRHSFVRFDITKCNPALSTTADVKSAALRLYATSLPGTCRTQDIFRVGASWTETGITWSNQPFGTTINNPPTAQRTASINVGPSGCQNSAVGYVVWDVTTDVQAFVAVPATNNGWMIRDDVEDSSTTQEAVYSQKDLNTVTQSPQLVITYVLW